MEEKHLYFVCLSCFYTVQDKNLSGEDNDDIDWDTEDELEIQEIQDTVFSSCTDLRTTGQHVVYCDGEVNASTLC